MRRQRFHLLLPATKKDIVLVLRELHVSAFPVLDEAGHVVGVVSEADLLLKEAGQEALGGYLLSSGRRGGRAKAAGLTAAELMTTPAVTIRPDDSLADAARLMHDRHVKRLPVVDQAGRLVGIVSQVDLLGVFDPRQRDPRRGAEGHHRPRIRPRPGRLRCAGHFGHRYHHRAG